jgi:secretion/DNA translocation related TadE-like protein
VIGRGRTLGDDRGGATVLMLAIGLVTVLVAIASAAVGAAIVARHRAQNAADLAALAGALDALDGVEVACARAGEIATQNGGHLTACDVDGLDIVVTVQAWPTGLAAMAGSAHASARAGPVEPAVPGTADVGQILGLGGSRSYHQMPRSVPQMS